MSSLSVNGTKCLWSVLAGKKISIAFSNYIPLWIIFFQVLLNIHDHRWGSEQKGIEKRTVCAAFESNCFVTTERYTHPKLREEIFNCSSYLKPQGKYSPFRGSSHKINDWSFRPLPCINILVFCFNPVSPVLATPWP